MRPRSSCKTQTQHSKVSNGKVQSLQCQKVWMPKVWPPALLSYEINYYEFVSPKESIKIWNVYGGTFTSTKKGPNLWSNKWILHYDNVPSHLALSMCNKEINTSAGASNIHAWFGTIRLFGAPKWKGILKRTNFELPEDIQRSVKKWLEGLSKNYLQAYQECWNICIKSEGDKNH
jgi:hypothetical protein